MFLAAFPGPTPDAFYQTVYDLFLPNALAFVTACLSALLAGLIIKSFAK